MVEGREVGGGVVTQTLLTLEDLPGGSSRERGGFEMKREKGTNGLKEGRNPHRQHSHVPALSGSLLSLALG